MSYFAFIIWVTAIICVTIIVVFPVYMVFQSINYRRRSRSLTQEEDEILRNLWDGLGKMEDRIGNLETILLQKRREESERF